MAKGKGNSREGTNIEKILVAGVWGSCMVQYSHHQPCAATETLID